MKNKTVVCKEWVQYEPGWGLTDGGRSLHLNLSDLERFVEGYFQRNPESTCQPDQISQPYLIDISPEIYAQIKKSKKFGIMTLERVEKLRG